MKRDINYFKEGHVYNKQYYGTNELYKRQNGQTTIRVIKIDGDKIVYYELYDQYPSLETDELMQGPVFWNLSYLVNSQDEYKYTEVFDKSEYIVHSQIMKLSDALSQGLIKLETIQYMFRDQRAEHGQQYRTYESVCTNSSGGKFIALKMPVEEGVSDNKMLQTIVFKWDTREQMQNEIREVFPNAWFI